jgi:hypothetical protein
MRSGEIRWGAKTTQGCEYYGGATLRKSSRQPQKHDIDTEMEDDRAQVDLGIAVDVEERLEEAAVQRQPKKRFVGRKAAEAAASRTATNGNVEDSGAIEGKNISHILSNAPLLIATSIKAKTDASDAESSPSRDPQ